LSRWLSLFTHAEDPSQGSSLLGLAVLFLLGLALVLIGQALQRSNAFYQRLVEHMETQRRLAGLPDRPLTWSGRERRYVPLLTKWAGVMILGTFVWLIING